MKQTYTEFLDTVKVLRMLYGVEVAKHYYEQNFTEFTGAQKEALQNLKLNDTLEPTTEN